MGPQGEVVAGVAPEWAALAAGGPLLAGPGWLRAMDGRLGAPAMTVIVRAGGLPVLAALATVQTAPRPYELFDLHHVLVSAAPDVPLTEASRARRADLADIAPPASRWLPYLLVMLPGYECVPVGPGAGDAGYLDALVVAAQRWAADHAIATVAFLYVRPDSTALAGVLAGHGYTRIPLTRTWDIPVPLDGLRGHLGAQPRKRRQEAMREMRRLAAADVTIERIGPADITSEPVLRRLTELRCHLVRKYRGGADPTAERRRLDTMVSDVCGGAPEVFAAAADGLVLGFALFAPWHDEWYCLAVGFDYDDPRSRMAYFCTAYYDAVAAAAEAGVRRLRYGLGSAEAKQARGCVGTPLYGWVRSSDAELAATVRATVGITELR